MSGLRNARHHALSDFGEAAQQQLELASALIIGLGGLGCPAAAYLAAAGAGRLLLTDFDTVDEANLHRQILFNPSDTGRDKVAVVAERLSGQNPQVELTLLRERMDADSLARRVEQVDVVLDGSDNFATRFAVNDACVAAGTPLVSGSAIRWSGQLAVFDSRLPDQPCYRCLFPDTDDSEMEDCAGNGVFAPLVGVIGAAQAVEAIKLVTGRGESLAGRLLRYDAWSGDWRGSKVRRDPACPTCGDKA